jgi:translation initiation factor IF-2
VFQRFFRAACAPITKAGTCMSLGIMVTMNQRLDAETLTIVADEFGMKLNS